MKASLKEPLVEREASRKAKGLKSNEKIMSCAYNSISVAESTIVVYFTNVSPRNVTSRLQSNKLDPVPI